LLLAPNLISTISAANSVSPFDFLKGKTKLKTEPLSILLFAVIEPPCDSTNFLAIASPSPVPPYSLEVSLDAC